MKNEVYYLLNEKQLNRYRIISNVIEGNLDICDAAENLSLSERHIYRLVNGVEKEGVSFLIHKNTDRKPTHAFKDDFIQNIVKLKKSSNYKDSNFMHFKELLLEHEGISISYNALYSILTSNGIVSPKKKRKPQNHHRRKRKARKGMLIQMDATPFEWFGGTNKYSLHGAIDDASGEVVGLYMTKNECLHGYLEITRQFILNYGIPTAVYTDMHTIFRSPNASKITIEEQLDGKVVNDTQYGRAMNELGIARIFARSPQAKGRVEKLWDTLQGRLPTEFKIHGITTVEEANEFLASYIPKFNSNFAVECEDNSLAYIALPDNLNLDHILCVKQIRSIDNSGVFSIHNRHFQILKNPGLPEIPKKSKITVIISTSVGIKAEYQGNVYEVINFIKPKKINETKQKTKSKYTPPNDHYFKYGHKDRFEKVYFDESYEEILSVLQEIFLSKHA